MKWFVPKGKLQPRYYTKVVKIDPIKAAGQALLNGG